MGVNALVGAVREAGIHGPSLIRRVHQLIDAVIDEYRQTLPAEIRITSQRAPATIDKLTVGLGKAGRRGDFMCGCIQVAAFAVATLVQREKHLGGKFSALFHHLINRVRIDVGIAWNLFQHVFCVEQFMHHKLNVA